MPPKLNCIYFYLTEGCNLFCRHCWIQPKFQNGQHVFASLPLDLFKSIIEQAKPLGLTGVKLTGGEPLLHPDIKAILDYIIVNKLNLTVETNGVLCTAELAQKMKTAKGAFVSVSVDGADAATHEWVRRVPGSFAAAWTGVRNLVTAGFKPQVIMSIMRRNKDQIEDVVKLAEKNGAGSVKFNLIQPTARGKEMHENDETLSLEELVELGAWIENTLAKQVKIKLIYSHPVAFRPLGRIFGKENAVGCGTCGIFGIIGVLSNGHYALCGIGETVPEFNFGDAAKDKLADVWQNNPMLNKIRDGLPKDLEGVCHDCVMKNRCLGFCLAQNYYSTKNLWASFWYCQQAHNKKLFPRTRLIV
ncbi:SynChlorMet cassette radical SAM/SPASM protein ScmF [Candidatus Saganbacteria bacterium]|nr:SynChlorMet cassette radical SAM/SPASM protein ScmF [Candidatus Saganbacteria bacterium]